MCGFLFTMQKFSQAFDFPAQSPYNEAVTSFPIYNENTHAEAAHEPILIVDDNEQIVSILAQYIKAEGWPYLAAHTGAQALSLFDAAEPSVILLDIMLPDIDGLEICRRIRRVSSVPILMVTARDEDADRILGLDIGADDYIVKPFSPGEVMARIRAVLRRLPSNAAGDTLVIGTLSIHLPSLSVSLAGHKLALTRKEVELLYTLAASPGRVFTRDNLLTLVWGYDHVGNYRAVDSHIKRLRQKLDAYPHDFFSIATVWGVGYKFERTLP